MYASKIWRRTNRLSIVPNEAVSTVVLLSFAPTAIERDRCVGVKCSESFWQPVQRTTHEAHVIGMVEIGCEGGRRGKDFEILSQDFATAAATFSVFDGVEERLQAIVRAGH